MRLIGDGVDDVLFMLRYSFARPNFHSVSDWPSISWYVSDIMAIRRLISMTTVMTRKTPSRDLARGTDHHGFRLRGGRLYGSIRPNREKKSISKVASGVRVMTPPPPSPSPKSGTFAGGAVTGR